MGRNVRETNLTKMKFFEEVAFKLSNEKNHTNQGKNIPEKRRQIPWVGRILDWFEDIKKTLQFSSVAQSCLTLCDPMNCSTPGLPVHHQLPEFTQTHVHRVRDAMQPSHPPSFPFLPAANPYQHQSLFQWVNTSMKWPKYWSFSFNIIPSKEIPGLIFRMDWLDLLAVQGTLKSLLQHHSSKTSIPRRSAFFTVQLSHPYMTTGKTIALTRRTFVGKVMSLLLNMLSRWS